MQSSNNTNCCPLCQIAAKWLLTTQDFNRRTDASRFEYYRCPQCQLIFLGNVPSDLSKYYPSTYHTIPTSLDAFKTISATEEYKIALVKQFIQQGKLLEIGPSIGHFAYLAKQAGFEVEALEMDPHCCRFLKDKLQISTKESNDIPSAIGGPSKYNVIALWQVIEHLQDPWKDLRAIVSALAPGGYLIIAAPNPQAFQFKILRHRWTHLDAPRHISIIPYPLLMSFLGQLNMKAVFSTTHDEGAKGWNIFGWKFSLSSISSNTLSDKLLRKFGRILSLLFYPIETRQGLGSSYTIVLKKGE